ncbi:hypothetical protein [Nocardioides marmotae]|uniref:DUF4244 domain-containing protein n=1 Tax=Nocardioides marmotae TaxID=2663857 RepID=A0A6I3JFG8_9ACTN|nr:hypothetical protein [Nocardioides marmotae]MCR6033369.1 hypothetical protein [Gordonia jinghuaiqii]MBC9734126.1 hypothetical protein [Nocardioides marmotae]MTB85229.1 hypothetical protein [Nocardioides marmotae]MTB97026.1 hypothetical protein [Nocardioides marmotae]QKD99656.1 hypothetical protein HPC71_05510 [Nocardioides marmotae]
MEHLDAALQRLHAVLSTLTAPRERDERGDVPGWVLVTVMTAGLVMVIWQVADQQLTQLLNSALGKVR